MTELPLTTAFERSMSYSPYEQILHNALIALVGHAFLHTKQ